MNSDSNMEYSGRSRNDSLSELIDKVQSEKTKNYIINRIVPQMKWYSNKSRSYQQQYYHWMTVTIIISALVPVVSVFADGSIWVKALLASLGAAVTSCNAYISLHNFKDLWLTYRKTRELLLRTLYCYFNNVGLFSQSSTQEKKDELLISVCENELSEETDEWKNIIKN